MTLTDFAQLTLHVISEDEDEFTPTCCFPSRKEIRTVTGIPDGVDLETATLSWAADHSQPCEEYFVAIKKDPSRLKVIRVFGAEREELVLDLCPRQ